jgi:hypothetical protein
MTPPPNEDRPRRSKWRIVIAAFISAAVGVTIDAIFDIHIAIFVVLLVTGFFAGAK